MSSLKQTLKRYIYQRGRVSYDELEQLARQAGRRASNLDRRLREIVSEGRIKPLFSDKHYIIGYMVSNAAQSSKNAPSGLVERQNSPKRLTWRQKLKLEQEAWRVAQMPRNAQGRIVAC